MGEAKPTPGPWWLDEYGNLRCGVPVYRDRVLITGISIPNGNSKDYEEAKANRDLLFDAGTVFHTTGLTPSQLVERVKELEEALMVAVNQNEHDMLMTGEELRAARAALSKARPNTAEGEAQADSQPARQGKWTWVPVEPSTAMLVAGNHGQPGDFSALTVWQDMLGALERSFDYTRPVDPPSTTPAAPADSVLEDAALWRRMAQTLLDGDSTLEQAILADEHPEPTTIDEVRAMMKRAIAVVDSASKQSAPAATKEPSP